MIGATGEAILPCLMEVITEIVINDTGTLRRLHEDKAHRVLVDDTIILQFCPVDRTLVMTDINTMNLVTLRITDIAIKGTPTEAEWTDKDIIEEKDIERHNQTAAYPPRPTGSVLKKSLKQTHQESWPLVADRTRQASLMLRFAFCRHND